MSSELFLRAVSPASLREAWRRVRRGGKSPGVDGVSVARFQDRLEQELAAVRRELLVGAYRPRPVRRVAIPKASGGLRLIGVQAVRDRLVQRALLPYLEPRVEAELEDCSFAYRPGRSVEAALSRLGAIHNAGFDWAARADVELCFDSLDRPRLKRLIRGVLPERDARKLMYQWLGAGVVDECGWWDPKLGVSQGDVMSPLLCNLYLDAFDESLLQAGWSLIRYADDFVILGRTRDAAQLGLREAASALRDIRLHLNRKKSSVGSFLQGFEFLGAAVVGSLMLPLHRVARPGRPPRFTYGYERAAPRPGPAPRSTDRALQDRLRTLARAEQSGIDLPPMQSAMLEAWRRAGMLRDDDSGEGWQSVYLI